MTSDAPSSCDPHAWEDQGTAECNYPGFDLVLQACAVCGTERIHEEPCAEAEKRRASREQVAYI